METQPQNVSNTHYSKQISHIKQVDEKSNQRDQPAEKDFLMIPEVATPDS